MNLEKNDQYLSKLKSAVFDALAADGIIEVAVPFDGYGDSGQIGEISVYLGYTQGELPKVFITIPASPEANSNEPSPTVDRQLSDVLETLCYDYLEEQHPGWEIDGGSDGRFTFDVANRVINFRITKKDYEYFEDAF